MLNNVIQPSGLTLLSWIVYKGYNELLEYLLWLETIKRKDVNNSPYN
jgi:hypothetical protein